MRKNIKDRKGKRYRKQGGWYTYDKMQIEGKKIGQNPQARGSIHFIKAGARGDPFTDIP